MQEIPCYRDPFTELCKQLVLRKLSCGHKASVICGEALNDETIKCSEKVLKGLPCGHTFQMECHKSLDRSFTCNMKVEQRLKCGHTILTECSSPFDAKCDKILKRELPCRHVIEVPCRSYDATRPVATIFCRYLLLYI